MGGFRSGNFVNEFAYRTKLNYYRRKNDYAKDDDEKQRYSRLIEDTEKEMQNHRFEISEYYEVTDLINSLVGLLIFPESEVYRSLPYKEEDLKRMFPRLHNCTLDKSRYHNDSNLRNDEERDSPQELIRHLRNAISHHHIGIVPISANVNGKRRITDISFEDDHGRFELKISVDDLEDIIMEMCNAMIKVQWRCR